MTPNKLLVAVLLTAFTLPVLAVDVDNNPPGKAGGPGTNWENPPGPRGGPGASPDRRPHFSPEQREQMREKLKAMTPEERQAFMKEMRAKRMAAGPDKDGNPPGPAGGPGTNWENPPGPRGGPGASPDRRPHFTPEQREQMREKLKAMTPEERQAFMKEMRDKRSAAQPMAPERTPVPQP